MTTKFIDKQSVSTMMKERENTPFDVRALSIAQHGSQELLELKEKQMIELERNPLFYMGNFFDLTKDQLRELTMKRITSLVHYVTSETVEDFQRRMELIGLFDPGFWTRFGVHYGLFLGAIRSGATANQFSYWIDRGVITLQGMVGCFGMTELQHGSNVAGLETRATFDPKTDEFVIHTPHLGATKWWIGGAAQTATHCSVFARLIVDGKDYGVKTFIVPLRNTKSFALLPGINIGDIGKKMGRDGIDNGYIQFTNVRIPRAYMLMKHTQVTREGEVREPPLAQLTYGALLGGRTAMVADSANTAKKALTISIRYAAVRRQFKSDPSQKFETLLLDYPIHQRRLIPLLSQAVAFGFTALEMTAMYDETTKALEALEPGDPNLLRTVEMLKQTHSTSAGLKAFCTWATLDAIEKSRQSLGGHGYSAYNGLANMFSDFAVHCTWEGDNTILALQSGRFLVQAYVDATSGKPMSEALTYLANGQREKNFQSKATDAELDTLEGIQNGFDATCAALVRKAADDVVAAQKTGLNKQASLEACSQATFVAASVHTSNYIFRQFHNAIKHLPATSDSNGVRTALTQVAKLYGLWQIEEKAAHFLRAGWLAPTQLDKVQTNVSALCKTIRGFAVPLTDSFALSDHIINSPFGRADGNVYAEYFRLVRRNNPQGKEHPYLSVITDFIHRPNLEVDDLEEEIGIDEEIEEIRAEQLQAAEAAKGENN